MSTAVIKDVTTLPEMLNAAQVQQLLGLSRVTAYRMMKLPGFPVVHLGRTLRVPRQALMRWIEAQTA